MRQAVIVEAVSWIGTPYHHRARVKGTGVDCATFLAEVFERVGLIQRAEVPPYLPDWMLHRDEERLRNGVESYARLVIEPEPGDILLWRIGRCYSHGAIFLGGTSIIHVYVAAGCVMGSTDEARLSDHPRLSYSVFSC